MMAWLRIGMILFLGLSFLTGCSDNKGKKEKSTIERTTDKAAKEAVDRIKVPLEQARMAAERESIQNRQLEEQEKKK
jgi:hypothetical protein